VTLAEDLPQIRSEQTQVLATRRNLAVSLHRLAGATNIAKALRNYGRNSTRPFQTIQDHLTLSGPAPFLGLCSVLLTGSGLALRALRMKTEKILTNTARVLVRGRSHIRTVQPLHPRNRRASTPLPSKLGRWIS
jgi:hypothetical protein